MVNVKIVDSYNNEDEEYEAVKKDYLESSLTCRQLQIKYSMSPNKWDKMVKRIKKETGLSRKAGGRKAGVIVHEI